MIKDASPVTQALLGTLMTWGLTAAGAAVAFFMKGDQVILTDSTFKQYLLSYTTYVMQHIIHNAYVKTGRAKRSQFYNQDL